MAKKKNSSIQMMVYIVKNIKTIKAFRVLTRMRTMLVRANMELGKLSFRDEMYVQRVNEFNQAMILSAKGRWHMDRALISGSGADWRLALGNFNEALHMAEKLYEYLKSGVKTAVKYRQTILSSENTEILFADGVPLVPEINPVVVLKGSDFEMGYQYAQQVIQIFGKWIFQRKAGRIFTEEETGYIRKWEEQIRVYAPEILAMYEGWAAGATDAGVPMSYLDVLEIWTDHNPPAQDYLKKGDGLQRIASPLCSGAAAWGSATTDGKLVTGSTGDHDPTYMVTIVAFPDTGNSFVYTPFSVIGEVPLVGPVYMMGHPGMNSKGLAYVEHGGEMRMVEPKKYWGYGIRRGTSVFHILRFADNAEEAREMELSWPVGDIGCAMGSVGGFYADSSYGYVMESRKEPLAIREAGLMGEKDFLFANNSAMHPGSGNAGWMQKSRDNWEWHPNGGWHPKNFSYPDIFSLKRKKGSMDRISNALSVMYNNSFGRNIYLYGMLNDAAGNIDLEYMKTIFRKSGTVPPGTWKETTAAYRANGSWGKYSAGHAGNALVTVMKPDEGIYALCVSEAARGLTPNLPEPNSGPTYAETNAFWELKLASGPKEVAEEAGKKAMEYIDRAKNKMRRFEKPDAAFETLKQLLSKAEKEYESGSKYMKDSADSTGNAYIYNIARAVRAFSRSQVRALQAYQALVPPRNE